MNLDGIIVPLVTPLNSDESLDERGLAKLIDHVIAGGVSGVFVLGSSGEGPALLDETKERLVRAAREQCHGRVPLLVGAFGVGTRQTIDLAKRLLKQGGDAVVVNAPFYFSLNQDEIAAHVVHVARALDVPTMFYNIPQMSKTITEPATVARMAQTREIIAVKDSWGDLTRFQALLAIKQTRPDFEVYQGAEGVAALSIARGANGGVLGLANVAPQLCCDLFTAARSGDWARAWQLQERLMLLWKLHTHGQWLPCLKLALSQLGICEHYTAAPFTTLHADAEQAIRADMKNAGVLGSENTPRDNPKRNL